MSSDIIFLELINIGGSAPKYNYLITEHVTPDSYGIKNHHKPLAEQSLARV
jgi:hypothetical protein